MAGQTGPAAAAADELYGLPLDEFTAARNERAKQARAQGDREAAAAIGKLAKPNTVAWLANQLARQHPGEIRPLLELGDSMRQATAALDADQLRQLSRRQQQAVRELLQQARSLASAAGLAFPDGTSRGLAETLHAAVADEEAARQLSQGRLTSGLARSGFPGIDAWSAAAPASSRSAPAPSRSAPPRAGGAPAPQDRARQRAREELDAARAEAQQAATAREQAQAALAQAELALRQAADNVDRCQAELDAALTARAGAGRARRQAMADAERADRAASQAGKRLQNATSRAESATTRE
jgi:hypothetical protein